MSLQLIQQYHAKVERIIRYGGSRNESALRKPFQDLLEQYAASRDLLLVSEVEYRRRGVRVIPDGTLKDALRQDWGYWESKDEKDNLADEIAAKLVKGYPTTNILFEDTHTAVFYQAGAEVQRADFAAAAALDGLLTRFVSYESEEVRQFHAAIAGFNADVPALAAELRTIIEEQVGANAAFRQALGEFLELCRNSINPRVEMADVREMLIQHVLTEDIFMTVFDEPQFHRDNAIAHKLQEVVATFYRAGTQRRIHARIAPFYETINARAAQIANHHEKQKFLKAVYGSFYRAYNPKAADRLGIIYTPDEIVRFKIEAVDYLVFKHFGKTLGDQGVEILDPVVGTGTYVTELIDYLPPEQLRAKYLHEIHCNEVAILPYYIASLNIEYTYKQRTGEYLPFENICFVDTLDNLGFKSAAPQMDFFGLVDENAERIVRQNKRRISVIIGNPPYNANQANENENNKNREYPEIDRRIKETYIRHSTAQKTKVYDMYARFLRWASDRIDENGVVAFITNNSFLDSRTFDGFRKVVADEFSHIYVVDLGGNVRDNPKLSGTTHNVFGIQTGVAIVFLVKKQAEPGQCRIFYARRPEMELARDKLQFLRTTRFAEIEFEVIHPDERHNWLHLTENDWDELTPVASKEVKASKGIGEQQAIFGVISTGILTGRDDWTVDVTVDSLAKKMAFFVDFYESALRSASGEYDTAIKWSRNLKRKYDRGVREPFAPSRIHRISYRPYCPYLFYDSDTFIDETALMSQIFGSDSNELICFTNLGSQKPFMALASKHKPDYHLVGAASGTQCLPLYRYKAAGDRVDNVTDWALAQFQARYVPHPLRASLAPLSHGERGDAVDEHHFSNSETERENEACPSSSWSRAGGEGDETTAIKIKPPLPPELLRRVRELRQDGTQAEQFLWQLLRNRQLMGLKFRRQHPLRGYILDFYCHEAGLAVELDGSPHAEPEQAVHDSERTEALALEGVRVLRFWNHEVLHNTETVLHAILSALTSTATTSPLPVGEGGERSSHGVREITKLDIFHYVYAVLHHPAYRAKYERNLKRELPRIPFYDDFPQWAAWGEQLMALHLDYEQVAPYPLAREDRDLTGLGDPEGLRTPKPRLIARKEAGVIEVDAATTLRGVPAEAWEYRLGTYSALEWVLERHKERTPKDPTIRERFNTYRFADYKEQVIDLLLRVTTVSVETMKIIRQMPG